MIFRPFYTYETGCAGYLLGCGGLGKCVAEVPPKPAEIDAILRSNRGRAQAVAS